MIDTLKIEMISCGRTVCYDGWAGKGQTLVNDDVNRLYWLHSGEAHVEYHDVKLHLRPERLYVIPAYCSGRFECPEMMDQSWCHFKALILDGLNFFDVTAPVSEIYIEKNRQSSISGLWEELVLAFSEQRGNFWKFRAEATLQVLLSEIITHPEFKFDSEKLKKLERFMSVLSYMKRNLERKITVAELAGVINLQENYFINVFKDAFGQSPLKYLNGIRIKKARGLLKNSNQSIKEIAEISGFGNEFYFSKIFNSYTGVCPSKYRQLF